MIHTAAVYITVRTPYLREAVIKDALNAPCVEAVVRKADAPVQIGALLRATNKMDIIQVLDVLHAHKAVQRVHADFAGREIRSYVI